MFGKLSIALKPSMTPKASCTPAMYAAFGPSWSGTATYQPLCKPAKMSIATDLRRKSVAFDLPPFCRTKVTSQSRQAESMGAARTMMRGGETGSSGANKVAAVTASPPVARVVLSVSDKSIVSIARL